MRATTLLIFCLIASLGATAGKGSNDDDDKKSFLTTIASCTGDCRPDKFPRCTGSCVVVGGADPLLLSGKDFTVTLAGCTGTCTDVNFPVCEGQCTANAVRIDDDIDGESDDDLDDDNSVGTTKLPRPTLVAISCIDGCTVGTFPKCSGKCTVPGVGPSATGVDDSFSRSKFTVGPCTGACTPETWPLCDGACEVKTVALLGTSGDKSKGKGKGPGVSSIKKTSSNDKKKKKDSKKSKGKGEKRSKSKGKGGRRRL